jgi:hypothetical protein
MWPTKFSIWACSSVGLFCGSVPSVSTIQSAYEREASVASSLHDKGLTVLEANCADVVNGQFLCQVAFSSKDDPAGRLYFDIVAVAPAADGWQLKSGLCRR